MSKRVSVGQAELGDRPHALYRFFDRSDVLLYVGITVDLAGRMKNHRKDKPWWAEVDHISIEHFASRQAALAAESVAIRDEKPLHNVQHNEFLEVNNPSASEDTTPDAVENPEQIPCDQGSYGLARWLLQDFDEVDVDRYVRLGQENAERDGEDQLDNPELAMVRGAVAAMSELDDDVHRLEQALFRLFGMLPLGLIEECRKRATDLCDANLGDTWSATDHNVQVAEQVGSHLARWNLRRRPTLEIVGWIACARQLVAPDATELEVEARAEFYARQAARHLTLTGYMCHARDASGAMCATPPAYSYTIASCPARMCAERCDGHYGLCHEHLTGAESGTTRWSTGEALKLASVKLLGDPGTEPAF